MFLRLISLINWLDFTCRKLTPGGYGTSPVPKAVRIKLVLFPEAKHRLPNRNCSSTPDRWYFLQLSLYLYILSYIPSLHNVKCIQNSMYYVYVLFITLYRFIHICSIKSSDFNIVNWQTLTALTRSNRKIKNVHILTVNN